MGLDSVELLIEIEGFFGIEIPNLEAEKIYTVGDFSNSVVEKLELSPSQNCLSQQVFYGIRQALDKFKTQDKVVTSDSKLSELFKNGNLKKNWISFENSLGLKIPKLVKLDLDKDLDRDVKVLGIKIYSRPEPITENSIRQLVDWIVSINYLKLIEVNRISSKYEVERAITGIISEKMGIPVNEIEAHHRIVADLGIE